MLALTVPLVSFAQPALDLQAEIHALMQQIQALQGELQGAVTPTPAPVSTGSPQAAPTPAPPTPVAGAGCVSISRTLSLGAQGKDVTSLQRFLAIDSSVYPEGIVSGFFGPLTERAVKQFQVKYGIVSSGSPQTTGYGIAGPRTRALVLEKSCGVSITEAKEERSVPRCAIRVDRSTVLSGEPVTVSWNSENASYAIDNTTAARVELKGSAIFYPKADSTFTYSFFGYTVSLPAVCSIRVTVAASESFPAPTPTSTSSPSSFGTDTFIATPSQGSAPLYVQFIFKPRVGFLCSDRALSIEYSDGESAMLEANLCASAGMRSVYHLYKKTGAYAARVYDNSACVSNTRCSSSAEIARALIAISGLSACTAGEVTMPHGASRDFYSAPTALLDETCASRRLSRLCLDGTLLGDASYSYSNCTEAASASCTLDGVTVANGSSRTFYSASSVASGSSCTSVSESRTCGNGTLSGSASYNKAACVTAAPVCTLDGITLAHGSSTTFYFAQNVPARELCSSYGQARVCTNGTLSGSASYKYSTCAPVSSNSCALDNVVVTNNSSAPFYRHRTAPAGELCSAHVQTRMCTNGSLGGSAAYLYASCANQTTCTLDGITLGHSSSTVFYKERAVAFGFTCSSISLSRSCTNGKLSGGDEYKYASCSVTAP